MHTLRRLGGTAPLAASAWLLLACGESVSAGEGPTTGSTTSAGGGGSTTSSTTDSGGGGGEALEPQSCPPGQFAVGFDGDGALECEALDDRVAEAVSQGCSVYFGWRDSCDGCADPPHKWGRVDGISCDNGAGSDSTCIAPELDGNEVQLFGLNTDGDVNGDDKFHLGLFCPTGPQTPTAGPCEDGEFVASVREGFVECIPARNVILEYVRERCAIYLGWRDSCNGCADPPAKWGRVQQGACQDGAGEDNSCATPFLGGQWVRMFGMNTNGDVNGDDKFYLGLSCDDAEPAEGEADGACPPGRLLVGINADGSIQCANAEPQVQPIVRSSCLLYGGWRDSCNGCSDPPSKWGRAGHQSCEVGAGEACTCTTATLGGRNVELLGLNTDGDVNGDDKLYLGWQCF